MIENNMQKLEKLDNQDGINFAQWSITMVTTGTEDCPYDKWRKPPFELVKLNPNEHIGITSGEIIKVK